MCEWNSKRTSTFEQWNFDIVFYSFKGVIQLAIFVVSFVNQVDSSKYMSVYFILPWRFSEEHNRWQCLFLTYTYILYIQKHKIFSKRLLFQSTFFNLQYKYPIFLLYFLPFLQFLNTIN